MNSEMIKAIDKETIVPTYSRYDMTADSGKGASCFDKDGKKYIDFTSGIGVNSLGFCDDAWIEAVTAQLRKLQHVSNLFYTEPQTKVAKILADKTGLDKVFFVNSGAEANETAIKTARKYGTTKKGKYSDKIITLENSFHGRTMATITATGQIHYHEYFTPFLGGFDYCKTNDIEQLKSLVDDETCAIMVEMIQGEGGVLNLDETFVKAIAEICEEKDILFIVDEVQTGIGRTGKLFAYEHLGIKPDIVTFAKGIGGGLPIGGALMSSKCCDILQPGDHGATYGGNPVACAGAYEVLSRMDDEFLMDVSAKGEYIKAKLMKMPQVKAISGKGLMIGISVEGKEAGQIVKDALTDGLMLLTAKDKVRMLPPLTITYEELDKGLEVFKKALI